MDYRNVYLAGPMTGIPKHNFPLFHKAAKWLRAQGYEVFNPAETDGGDTSRSRSYYMYIDFRAVLDADLLVLLPGWQNSRGATREVLMAQELDMPIKEIKADEFGEFHLNKCEPDIQVQVLAQQEGDSANEPVPWPEQVAEMVCCRDKSQAFYQVLYEMAQLHAKKQADYGRDNDPFANVRASTDFGVPAWVGCMIRANDKMRRLQSAASGSTLQNEGVEDSLMDMAVYSAIGVVLHREETANL